MRNELRVKVQAEGVVKPADNRYHEMYDTLGVFHKANTVSHFKAHGAAAHGVGEARPVRRHFDRDEPRAG